MPAWHAVIAPRSGRTTKLHRHLNWACCARGWRCIALMMLLLLQWLLLAPAGARSAADPVRGGNLSCSVGGSATDDMFLANLTLSAAAAWCRNNSRCAGFATPGQYPGICESTGVLSCHFKDSWAAKRRGSDPHWSYWSVPGPRPPPPPRPYDTPPNPCSPNVTDQPKFHIMNMGVGPHDLNAILHWKGVWHIMHQANWTDWAHVSVARADVSQTTPPERCSLGFAS